MIVGINLIALPAEKGSGAFRYIQMLLQAMGEYEIQGCEFIIYKQKQISKKYIGIPESLKVRYIDVPNLGMGIKRVIFEQTLFYKYLEPCDVLYSYCTSMPLFARCKKIFTLHDVYYITTKQRYGWLQRTYLTLITKIYCSLCDKVLTVSKFSFDEIVKFIGVKKEKIALTYNFVFPRTGSAPKKPQELYDVHDVIVDVEKPFFFYVGNLQPGKNIKGMIDGFLKYIGDRDNVQLIIAGKPTTYGDEMLQYIDGKDSIKYVGYQSRNNVDWLLENCVAVVLLSFCEGFGIPPIEGFSYGKPALTSNTTSLPEVVGEAGYMVNPYDIQGIADGYRYIEAHGKELTKYIPSQLEKFNPRVSVETFMSNLGVPHFELMKNSILQK